jgi:ribA/ribD-fused uncharacterized protein
MTTSNTITSFFGEYRFLSNFYDAPLHYEGRDWPHSEAAYQAMKSLDPKDHEHLANVRQPGHAKKYGKYIQVRPDWEFIKVEIMTEIVKAKFDQNPELKRKLLLTGYAKIEEGNDWGDVTWGISPPGSGIGKNYLGVILMKLREDYVSELTYKPGQVYAGIGSREVPDDIYETMVNIATTLGNSGWMLRSGGANGSDSAFETGAIQSLGAREIYLPWPEFNNRYSKFVSPDPSAFKIASDVHVRWPYLPPTAQSLIARNMHQIVGDTRAFPPVRSRCVICWTPDGCETPEQYGAKTGGTGSAIFLAGVLGIPVFNLKNKGREEAAYDFLLTSNP